MKGLVIKNTGSWYQVKTDDGQLVECKIKGNFRLKGIRSTNPVAVGDRVQIILNQEGTAFISEIEDRKNYIIRRSSNLSKQSHILAANLDQCMLVVTVNYPETSTTFIDRFLASAEAYRVPVKILFNKVDAYDEDELHYLDSLITLYTQIGYPCFKISALTGEGYHTRGIKRSGNPLLRTFGSRQVDPYQCPCSGAGSQDCGNISLSQQGNAHHHFLRNVPCTGRRIHYRHSGHQRFWYFRYGRGRDRSLLPRNIQNFGKL